MFWYRPLFMAQLLIGELIFACRLEKKDRFFIRLCFSVLLCIGASFAVPPLYDTGEKQIGTALVVSLSYSLMFAVTVFALKFSFRESFKNILFCAVAGYTIQHVSSEFYELFNVIAGINGKISSDIYGNGIMGFGNNWFLTTVYVFIYGVTYWWAAVFTSPKIVKYGVMKMKWGVVLLFATLLLFMDVIISAFISYSMPQDTPRLAIVMLHGYNAFCCFLALFLLLDFPRRKKMEEDLFVLHQLENRKAEQYVIAKDNVNLIQMKCHDLKHQIRRFSENSSQIRELEKVIGTYDAIYKTGNEALDVILTEKSLFCRDAGIQLAVIADGEKLSFMDATDIYSLFGNLFDNAIEAVQSFEPSERSVACSVREISGCLFVNVYNKYRSEIRFFEGLPVTTKKDKDWHGIGLKSVKYIADKYQGEMTISTEEQIFSVGILFPLPQERRK